MISPSLLSLLLIVGLLHKSFTYHIADKRQLLSKVTHNYVTVIRSPLYVNCSVSLCGGELSPIYCHGDIITNAWRFGLQDICPGTRMRLSPKDILKNFDKLQYPIEKKTFEAFCRYNFVNVPYLVNVSLPDYKARPRFLDLIRKKEHQKLAESVHFLWNKLARKFTDDVLLNTSFYPVVPVTNNFVGPGGRFQIFFYWDSYWILKGLYLSELLSTAKGMIQNFADVIYRNGFIPNSGSVQLSRRSQPPLFVQMVKDYFTVTRDVEYLRLWTPSMDKEMRWWIAERSVSVDLPNKRTAFIFLYRTATNCPRPENYLSDYLLGMNNTDPLSTWKAMSTACESGWDFSTRWFDHGGDRRCKFYEYLNDLVKHDCLSSVSYYLDRKDTIRTQTIVPVDLNVYMALNFKFLAETYAFLGNVSMSDWYKERYHTLIRDIHSLSWNENEGVWFDYDLLLREQRNAFYPSNVFPLLLPEMKSFAERVYSYLEKEDVYKYPGGIPTTLPVESFEQWDFPNVWAPTQHLFINSLLMSQHPGLQKRAMEEADKFIFTVYNGLFNPQEGVPPGLWEKYDARSSRGKPGDGGEYIVQEGFGWTNGVVMDLINMMNTHDGFVRAAGLSLLEQPERSWLVLLTIGSLLVLAVWFAVCGHFGYAGFVRNKVINVQEPSSRRLLEDSDSSE